MSEWGGFLVEKAGLGEYLEEMDDADKKLESGPNPVWPHV